MLTQLHTFTKLPVHFHGNIVAYTLIDVFNLARFKDIRWVYDKGYVRGAIPGSLRRYTYLHNAVLNVTVKKGYETDHINGDKLDNRRCNLRYGTRAENLRNRKVQRNSSSGVKGVNFSKLHKKWRVRISCNKKRYHLGLFDDLHAATMIYNKAALKFHGVYACLNPLN